MTGEFYDFIISEKHHKFRINSDADLAYEYKEKNLSPIERMADRKPRIIRTPIINKITDTRENLALIEEFIQGSKWEHIPYNKMAEAKYEMPGMEFGLRNFE